MASVISAGTSAGTALNLTGDTSGILQLASNNGTVGLTMDTSQNVGIGTAPSAWSGFNALDVGSGGLGFYLGGVQQNAYYNGSSWVYKTTNPATQYLMSGGLHRWGYATSGTANATFSFTEAMRIDSSGNVGIGTSSPATKLDVVGTIRASQSLAFGTNGTSGVGTIYSDSNWGCLITAKQASPALADFMWQNGSSVERMRIDSSGNLLVGTTTAIGKLTVAGLASAQTLQVKGSSSGSFSADAMFLQNEGPSLFRSYACGTNGSTYGQWVHYAVTSTGSPVSVFTASNGSFAVPGALSKGSGSFRIDHPLPELEETHQLVHSFIEGPQADLIYRGRVSLVNGKATVNIDEAATMTEGTFVVLCRDVQCFTTNESDWTPVRGSVSGNIITIESQDDKATSNISWMVIGERQDKHMMETNWTDESGKVIVEPLKVAPPLIMAGVNTETEGAK